MSEFDKVKQDIRDFNARIKNWDLNQLTDDEADEVSDILEETMALLAGEEDMDDEEDDFDDEDL